MCCSCDDEALDLSLLKLLVGNANRCYAISRLLCRAGHLSFNRNVELRLSTWHMGSFHSFGGTRLRKGLPESDS